VLAGLVGALALLAAPANDAAAQALKVAWASQYEWSEDGVNNATLEFTYRAMQRGRTGGRRLYAGRGSLVVSGGELVRVHLPDDTGGTALSGLRPHLAWVLARFFRKPFAEEFKDQLFRGPEDAGGGAVRVFAGKRAFLLEKDRLAGQEVDVGTPGSPFRIRVDFTTGDLGDGYGILATHAAYTRGGTKTTRSRSLKIRTGAPAPSPLLYVFKSSVQERGLEVTISFDPPRFNAKDPVVLEAAARDLLAQAWARRFTLPAAIRIKGEFERGIDNALRRAGWVAGIRGTFRVEGLDRLTVKPDMPRARPSWEGGVRTTCEDHLRGFFERLRPVPFEEEFKGCGFRFAKNDPGRTIEVFGYPKALAFKVEKRAITGEREIGEEGLWWAFKLKATHDGRLAIERMSTKLDRKSYLLRFRYTKIGGRMIPKLVSALGRSRFGARAGTPGIVSYKLSRLKVSLPR